MAAGEVLLNGSSLDDGSANSHSTAPNVRDANGFTIWSTYPAAQQGWVGIDAGVPCLLSRVRLSANPGWADYAAGGTIQAAIDAAFTIPFQTGNNNHINAANQATLTCVFQFAAQTAGDTNIVFVGKSSAAVISGVADTANGAYTLLASGNNLSAWIRSNIAAAPINTNTVTVTFSTHCDFPDMHILEYTGVVASPLDGFSTNTSTGTAVSSGSFTTTNAQDIIICYMTGSGASVHTAGLGFTIRLAEESSWNASTEDDGVDAIGTYNATFTLSSSQQWQCMAIALKTTVLSPVRYLSINNRPITGTLLNEYPIVPSGIPYRYLRYSGGTGHLGTLGDLDFIATWTPGLTAAAVAPVIYPAGGQFDLPIVVTLSCITTDAVMHYTLDGTTPTAGSPTYTGPFTVSTTSTLKCIAISTGVSNSRIVSAKFYIPSSFVSADTWYNDLNRGYRIWPVDPHFMYDPQSRYWYMYGQNEDEPGVQTNGYIGNNVYRSADLRNWEYRSLIIQSPAGAQHGDESSFLVGRLQVLYNALNNNYVGWGAGNSNSVGGVYTLLSSNPEGPFNVVAFNTNIIGFGSQGDPCIFQDDDGTAYICYQQYQNNVTFAKLSSDYTNVTGVRNNYNMVSAFGGFMEAPHMWKRGGVYFLMFSGTTLWVPNLNQYAVASSPIGPWTVQGNPFRAVIGGVAGTYTDNTVAYNTQNMGVLQIPGRDDGSGLGAFVYIGDAYNTGLDQFTGSSTTANFLGYTTVFLPVKFSGLKVMDITWNPTWRLDVALPSTNSKSPTAPSNFHISGSTGFWTNNEVNPHYLYFDTASNPAFTSNVVTSLVSQISTGPNTPFVQTTATHVNIAAQSSIVATYAASQSAGNTNIVFASVATGAVTGVSDLINGSYTLVASGSSMVAYISTNILPAAAGANVVTVTYSPACDFPDIHIFEYSNILSSPVDGTSNAFGTGTAASSGSITTTSATDVLVACTFGGGAPTHTPGSGFALRNDEPGWNGASEDKVVYSTGPYTGTFTLSASNTWTCMMVALKSNFVNPVTFVPVSSALKPASNAWYRIRAVNAFGTSVSNAVITVNTSGYYVVYGLDGVYGVMQLTAGADYSYAIQSYQGNATVAGPYATYQLALAQLILLESALTI